MFTKLLLMGGVLTALACAPAVEKPAPPVAGSTALTEGEVAELVLEAASIPSSLLQEVTDLGAGLRPDKLSTFPLSMLMFGPLPAKESDDFRLLAKADATPRTPRELWLDGGPDRLSLFPEGSIRIDELEVVEGTAKGSFHFSREGMWEGNGEFRAERSADAWRVVEIALPALKASTRLRDDGTWELVPAE